MAKQSAFVDQVLGLLLPLGPVRARGMFGGWGLFLEDVMFALITRERLFLKVDAETEPRFEAAGAPPFTYERRGKVIAMSYRKAPTGTMDNSKALLPWAELALMAARRGKGRQSKRKRRPRQVQIAG